MTDKRDTSDGMVTQRYIPEPQNRYPEVRVTAVHFIGDEIQIEQGTEDKPLDPKAKNDVISLSRTQALAVAAAINETLNKE